jgi:hypothetical protein
MLTPIGAHHFFSNGITRMLSQNQDAFFDHFQADGMLPKRFIDLFL